MTRTDIVDPNLERFIIDCFPPPSAVFRAMASAGRKERLPLIDAQVGRLLDLLVKMIGARRILEVGTCIGYSTAWLAGAAGPRGKVTSLEIDPQRAEQARKNLARAGLGKRVEIIVGDARKSLAALPGRFDLVFNDGDKRMYPAIARFAEERLVRGGLLVSDNALWGGQVARPGGDADTRAIRQHDRTLLRSAAFDATILPVRDGVLVARKK